MRKPMKGKQTQNYNFILKLQKSLSGRGITENFAVRII